MQLLKDYPRLLIVNQQKVQSFMKLQQKKYINNLLFSMKVKKHLILQQHSSCMQQLAQKHGTTPGICGFITCALVQHLANFENFTPQQIKQLNQNSLSTKIEEAMKFVLLRRRMELKKYYKAMDDNDRKYYMKDYVANYQIAQFIEYNHESFKNKQVYFFRQSSYDHPEELAKVKWEEKQRISQEQKFKGELYFFSSFSPYENHFKEEFSTVLKNSDPSKPVIIATDVLGHFYTVILWQGEVHILDSLSSFMQKDYDCPIVECIAYNYKLSMKP